MQGTTKDGNESCEVTGIVEEDTVGRFDVVADEDQNGLSQMFRGYPVKTRSKIENEDKQRVAYDITWYNKRVNTIL